MAFAFTWAWCSGTTWQDFAVGNLIGFYGSTTYGVKVAVNSYQDGMHLRTASGTDTDACVGPHMTNLKYLTASTVSIGGAGSANVNTIATGNAVRIRFTDGATAISTENSYFYCFDGSTDATPPTGVTPQLTVVNATGGGANWVIPTGTPAKQSLTSQGSMVTHDWFVGMSALPTSVGEKTSFAWKITTDYY